MRIFDLGKWHPELGNYMEWKNRKIKEFCEHHTFDGAEAIGLATGGVLLLVKGERYDSEKKP